MNNTKKFGSKTRLNMAGSKLSMSTYSQVPALSTAISQVIWPRAAAVSSSEVTSNLREVILRCLDNVFNASSFLPHAITWYPLSAA